MDNLSDEKGVEDEQQKQRQERKERLVGVLVADLVRTQRAEPCPRARQLRRIRLRIDHFHHLPHTHTHTFNGPFSGTTQVSRYQKGKTNLDFIGARDSEWQWHQLGHMQVCTSLQTDNHASTPPLSFYRPDALPAAQPTASKH